jgi:L-iditol 2-dehydrogenase
MKALVMHEYKKLSYEDVEKPVPGPGEVLVRLKACSVCGSDVHGFDGSTGRRRPPVIMGHEASGIIEEIGPEAKGWSAGDRVTFDSTIFCNECSNCRQGLINLCEKRRVLGVSCGEYNQAGCFAQYICLPSYILYKIPDNVSYVQASMTEPMSVAYHAATRTRITASDSVVLVGIGTIGLLTLQVVRSFGVKRLIAVDIDDSRLALALENGATDVINSRSTDAAAEIKNILKANKGASLAIDATGTEQTLGLCISSVCPGGRVVLIGNLVPQVSFPMQYVVTRQITIYGSCASAGEYPQCLDLLAAGKVNVDKMISNIVPLKDGNLWMNKIYNREKGVTKLVFLCDEEQ